MNFQISREFFLFPGMKNSTGIPGNRDPGIPGSNPTIYGGGAEFEQKNN